MTITIKHLEPTFRIRIEFPDATATPPMATVRRMLERHARNCHGYAHFIHIADFTETGVRMMAQELNASLGLSWAGKLANELLDALDGALADQEPEFEPLTRTIDRRVQVAISHEHPGGTIAAWEHQMALAVYESRLRYKQPSAPTMFAYCELVNLLGGAPKTYLPPEPVRVGPLVPLADEAWADIDAATAHGRDADGVAIVNRVPRPS